MKPALPPLGGSFLKPHFRNLSSSGMTLPGFTAEVNVEDGLIEQALPYPSAFSCHMVVLKEDRNDSTALAWNTETRGRKEKRFLPDDLIVSPAGLIAKPRWTATSTISLLAIDKISMSRLAVQAGANPEVEIVPTFGFQDPLLMHLARAVTYEFRSETPDLLYAETMCNAVVTHLLHQHIAKPLQKSSSKGGLSTRQLRELYEYMDANLDGKVRLADLARLAEVSSSHFVKQFRHATGVAPHQRLLQLRLKKVEGLLRNTRLSIAEIAMQTGFADQSHLTRMFRQHKGLTPLNYRRR